jgi:NAD-dependent SIR2 family protein deacetylase
MTEKRLFVLAHPEARRRAAQCIAEAPAGWKVEVKPPSRSLDQNALLWPLLEEVAKQVVWYGQKLPAEDWKAIFTASLKRSKVVPGIEPGSFVVCGQSTSKMSKATFSELLELIHAFAAEHNVKIRETA